MSHSTEIPNTATEPQLPLIGSMHTISTILLKPPELSLKSISNISQSTFYMSKATMVIPGRNLSMCWQKRQHNKFSTTRHFHDNLSNTWPTHHFNYHGSGHSTNNKNKHYQHYQCNFFNTPPQRLLTSCNTTKHKPTKSPPKQLTTNIH